MAEAELTVVRSELHTEYRVLARPLSDGELFPLPDEETIAVARGEDGVVIRSPWAGIADDQLLPAGFESAGTPSQGTGDDLVASIGGIANDVAVLVTATKDHAGRTSTVALRQASALFVRPDPDRLVELRAYVSGGHIDAVQLSGGQPRVLYRVRNGPGGVEHDLPAYFHGRVDGSNRGIDDLRVGMDLIPARDPGGDGLTAPLDPLVVLRRRPALDATLHLRAIDVRTGLTVQLDRTAEVPALPQIELVDAPVEPRVPAHVMIHSSTTGERYELRVDGVVSGEPTVGDGSDLELVTEPLDADALLQAFVSRPDGPGLPVERVLTLRDPVG